MTLLDPDHEHPADLLREEMDRAARTVREAQRDLDDWPHEAMCPERAAAWLDRVARDLMAASERLGRMV